MTKKITEIPVRNKRDGKNKLFLAPPPNNKCKHYKGAFEIDEDAGKCTCRECGAEVSPMFVLACLMNRENQWFRSHEQYIEETKRLSKRSRTLCNHCGKMTRISGR